MTGDITSVVFYDSNVYAASANGGIYKFAAGGTSPSLTWQTTVTGTVAIRCMKVAYNLVFVGTDATTTIPGRVYAFNASTSTQEWVYDAGNQTTSAVSLYPTINLQALHH